MEFERYALSSRRTRPTSPRWRKLQFTFSALIYNRNVANTHKWIIYRIVIYFSRSIESRSSSASDFSINQLNTSLKEGTLDLVDNLLYISTMISRRFIAPWQSRWGVRIIGIRGGKRRRCNVHPSHCWLINGKKGRKAGATTTRGPFQLKSSVLIRQSIRVRETSRKRKPACSGLHGALPERIKASRPLAGEGGSRAKYEAGAVYLCDSTVITRADRSFPK